MELSTLTKSQSALSSRSRAEHIAAWLKRVLDETDVAIWDAKKIAEMGWTWMRGAKYAVVCEGAYDWPQLYCDAEFKRVGKAYYLKDGAFWEPGSGWCMCVYK